MVTRVEIINKYGILAAHTTIMSMSGVELYSDGVGDPVIDAHLYGSELAGGRPYDVTVSMFGMELREGDSMFEMSHREKMRRQKLAIGVVVFRNHEFYEMYMEDGMKYVEDLWEE